MAADALLSAMDSYFGDERPVPAPSKAKERRGVDQPSLDRVGEGTLYQHIALADVEGGR